MATAEISTPSSPRALIIAAHPDDAEWGCGGTTALRVEAGWEVFYVVCTSGEQGSEDPEVDPEQLKRLREGEQQAAAALLGVRDVAFLGFPDGLLMNNLELRRELVRAIRHYRPDALFCHDPSALLANGYINHPDHRYAGAASVDAVFPGAGNHNAFKELLDEGLPPHDVTELFLFYTFNANEWVDISATLERKIAALRCHTSQIADPAALEKDVRNYNGASGREQGFQYAEAFRYLKLG